METYVENVLWFRECNLSSIPVVGGKNASLGELLSAGIPVPPGFAITTKAYTSFLVRGRIRDDILKLLEDVRPDKPNTG